METQARYGLIGAFTLAVIAAGFLFVYWLHTTGGVGPQSTYRLRFAGSVAGLRPGSSVLYNGIRVGEVKLVRIDPADPFKVEAMIGVEPETPIRVDTRVAIETQGLMGSPAVVMAGGTGATPSAAAPGLAPVVEVGPGAGETLTQSALGVLRRMDKLIADNSDPINNIATKLSTFSDALARNSGRIDSIAEGLDKMIGGGKDKKPAIVYDLMAPASLPALKKEPPGRLAILEPTALVVFDTQKVLVSPKPGQRSVMSDWQWSDSLPKLVQAKLIESFEKTDYLGHVSRADAMTPADAQLQLDIRNFEISTEAAPSAVIEVSAKLQNGDGQIVAARLFKAAAPVAALEPDPATAGLSAAFGKVAAEVVAWTNETL